MLFRSHWDFFLRRLRRRGGDFSSIGPWAVRPRTPDLLLARAKSRQKRARTIWFWTPLITGVFCFAPEAQSVWSKLTAVRSAGLLRLFQRGCRWPLPCGVANSPGCEFAGCPVKPRAPCRCQAACGGPNPKAAKGRPTGSTPLKGRQLCGGLRPPASLGPPLAA